VPQLPLRVWLGVAAVGLLVLGLCAVTTCAMLRAATRRRVSRWPVGGILALLGAAAVPWLVVWLAPITIALKIHGILPLLGWLLLALASFALLVLLPLAALLGVGVWSTARWRERRHPEAS
jgi:hypothetical protein